MPLSLCGKSGCAPTHRALDGTRFYARTASEAKAEPSTEASALGRA
jgi:hypothetical protein